LLFLTAAFCGNRWRRFEMHGFRPFRHERFTDLSTENVHNEKSSDKPRSYTDFAETGRARHTKQGRRQRMGALRPPTSRFIFLHVPNPFRSPSMGGQECHGLIRPAAARLSGFGGGDGGR
jgi:hypothetical protein